MKKTSRQHHVDPDRDTMRKEYDFSEAVRGVTAARYVQGSNIVVIDPEVLDENLGTVKKGGVRGA